MFATRPQRAATLLSSQASRLFGTRLMKAITVDPSAGENAGSDALRVEEVPLPEVGTGECLIKVQVTAVNRADIQQRQGKYPPPPGVTDVLGLECAGEIVSADTLEPTGEKVMALLPGGGYA